jgi:hypothetical protein
MIQENPGAAGVFSFSTENAKTQPALGFYVAHRRGERQISEARPTKPGFMA